MASVVNVLGIRHHGPGSARVVVRALGKLKPDAVLIEGPPDAAEITVLAGHKEMKPPVALLVYEWIGVGILRQGWVNLDLVWTAALVAVGVWLLV